MNETPIKFGNSDAEVLYESDEAMDDLFNKLAEEQKEAPDETEAQEQPDQ